MSTDPDRVKDVFLGATELPDEAARVAYLDHACEGDAGLRGRVEALLRAHDPDDSFLGTPAAAVPDPAFADTMTFTDPLTPDPDRTLKDETLAFLAPPGRRDSLGRIGHYEALQVLGRGGFGVVYRAFDDVLQRVVAVKVMAPQIAATSPARRRFLREARSSAQVRHENVVQVYEVGEQPLPYLVMEFIPGETLQQRLDRTGPLDVPETVRIGRQVAEGLAAAHGHDLIHRDIKPGNILLESGSNGRAKITDFGLARAADDASISQSGIVAGTPMYMAPEQAQGQPLDHRADLFSLGSLLYQMVAGRAPFRANSTVAVLKRVAEDQPRAIREIIPETPQWLCDIIAKLHTKNPDDRYQTAREVADVLADCEAQLKTGSKLRDFSRIPRAKPASSGRWKWAAATAILLLAVIALAVAELAGETHLFRGRQATTDPIKPAGDPTPGDVGKAGAQVPAVSPTPGPVAKGEPPALAAKSEPPPDGNPFTDADVRRIAALPAAQQVEEVRKELMRRNPGFDGTLGHRIEGGVVTALRIVTDNVTDIGPIRVFNDLRVLDCGGTITDFKPNGQLADLPLEGMNLAGLTRLNLGGTRVSDAGLARFRGSKNLESLHLHATRVGDPGLAHFKDCKNLHSLGLSGTKVTDAGLAHFKDCMNLTELNLSETRVGDTGLAHFKDCKSLKSLYLVGTQVSDAGLVRFEGCKDLTTLSLAGAQVGDVGLAHFKDCKGLMYLHLGGTNVSDAGLAHFKDCKSLTHLRLSGTRVSEAGLENLKGTPLKVLFIAGTDVTDLKPLQGMALEDIRLTPGNIAQGLDILRDMKSVKTIGIDQGDKGWPAAEFWERYDKGDFPK